MKFGYSKSFTISTLFTIHFLLYPRYTVYVLVDSSANRWLHRLCANKKAFDKSDEVLVNK